MGLGHSKISHYDLIKEGDSLMEKQQYGQAIARYSAALELSPKYWISYLKRGKAYAAEGYTDLALADLTEALMIEDTNAVRKLRSELYRKIGDNERAEEDLQRVMARKGSTSSTSHLPAEEREYWDQIERRQAELEKMNHSEFARKLKDLKRQRGKNRHHGQDPPPPPAAPQRRLSRSGGLTNVSTETPGERLLG